jgi:hypothetical protein
VLRDKEASNPLAKPQLKRPAKQNLQPLVIIMQALFSGASCDPAAPQGMQRNALSRCRTTSPPLLSSPLLFTSLLRSACASCLLTRQCSLAGAMEQQQTLAQRLQVQQLQLQLQLQQQQL